MQTDRERLRQLIEQKCLITSSDFTLSTGAQSSFYFDCKIATLNGECASLIAQEVLREFEKLPTRPAAIGGLTIGADFIVAAVVMKAYETGQPTQHGSIVRKEPKKHGTRNRIENQLPRGTKKGSWSWSRLRPPASVARRERSGIRGSRARRFPRPHRIHPAMLAERAGQGRKGWTVAHRWLTHGARYWPQGTELRRRGSAARAPGGEPCARGSEACPQGFELWVRAQKPCARGSGACVQGFELRGQGKKRRGRSSAPRSPHFQPRRGGFDAVDCPPRARRRRA